MKKQLKDSRKESTPSKKIQLPENMRLNIGEVMFIRKVLGDVKEKLDEDKGNDIEHYENFVEFIQKLNEKLDYVIEESSNVK